MSIMNFATNDKVYTYNKIIMSIAIIIFKKAGS